MVFLPSIPPKPPWYSTPTAIEPLPTAVPNCTSLIASSTDNCKNKSTNIANDRPDDNDDDVDCFPWQEKQPVLLQQDPSPTASTAPAVNDTSPSLIESPTDKPINTDTDNKNKNNPHDETTDPNTDNNNNDPSDVDDDDIDNGVDDDSTVIHHNRYCVDYDDDSYTDSYDYDDRHYDDDDDDDTCLAYSDDADYKFDYNNPLDADDGDDNNNDDDDDSNNNEADFQAEEE